MVLIVVVLLVGYLFPTIPPLLQRILYAIVIIVFILWLLAITGLFKVSLP